MHCTHFILYSKLTYVHAFHTDRSKTGLRKLQTEVKKRHEQQKMLNSRASTAAGSTRDGTQGSFADIDDNIFMPKKTIRRSDGASLSDIYASKKADAWGTILKAQLRDEVGMLLILLLLLMLILPL